MSSEEDISTLDTMTMSSSPIDSDSVSAPATTATATATATFDNVVVEQVPITEEIKQLKEWLPDYCGMTVTPDALLVDMMRSRVKQLSLKCHFLPGYPSTTQLAVELESDVFDDVLLKRLSRACASEIDKLQSQALPQAFGVVKMLHEFFQTNLVLSCWEEVQGLRQLVGKESVRVNEVKGVIKLKMTNNKYAYTLSITVPDMYPDEPISFKISKCNFPER
jgi:hypothetical protein